MELRGPSMPKRATGSPRGSSGFAKRSHEPRLLEDTDIPPRQHAANPEDVIDEAGTGMAGGRCTRWAALASTIPWLSHVLKWLESCSQCCCRCLCKALECFKCAEAYDFAYDRLRSKGLQSHLLTAVSASVMFIYATKIATIDSLNSFAMFVIGFTFCAVMAFAIVPVTRCNRPEVPVSGMLYGAVLNAVLMAFFMTQEITDPRTGERKAPLDFELGPWYNTLFALYFVQMGTAALYSLIVFMQEAVWRRPTFHHRKARRVTEHVKGLLKSEMYSTPDSVDVSDKPEPTKTDTQSKVDSELSDETDFWPGPRQTLVGLLNAVQAVQAWTCSAARWCGRGLCLLAHRWEEVRDEAPAIMDWSIGLTCFALLYCFFTRLITSDDVIDTYGETLQDGEETLQQVELYLQTLEDQLASLQTTIASTESLLGNLTETERDAIGNILEARGLNQTVDGLIASVEEGAESLDLAYNTTAYITQLTENTADDIDSFLDMLDDIAVAANDSGIYAQCVAFLISLVCLYKPLFDFQAALPGVRKGHERLPKGRWGLMHKLKMRFVPKFVGAQLSCVITQFYLVQFAIGLVLFAFLYTPCYDWWTDLFFVQYRNALIVWLVSYAFQNYYLYPFVYEKHCAQHARIARPSTWTVMTLSMSLYSIVTGALTGFLVVLYYFGWALCVIGMADTTILPDDFVSLDAPFAGFWAMQKLKHLHQNPVLVKAAEHLAGFTEEHEREPPRSINKIRARTRWCLLYTLVRNPKLVEVRLTARHTLADKTLQAEEIEKRRAARREKVQAEIAHAQAALTSRIHDLHLRHLFHGSNNPGRGGAGGAPETDYQPRHSPFGSFSGEDGHARRPSEQPGSEDHHRTPE